MLLVENHLIWMNKLRMGLVVCQKLARTSVCGPNDHTSPRGDINVQFFLVVKGVPSVASTSIERFSVSYTMHTI
jgi:hypothetical protein